MGNSQYNPVNNSNLYNKHGTIRSFESEKHMVVIMADDSDGITYYRLKKDNPDFVNLFHKLQPGLTYKFLLEGLFKDTIVDIVECSKCKIDIIVRGFLNLKHENNIMISCINRDFNNCEEVFFENNTNKRFMINNKDTKDIIIGSKYKFTYEKAFGSNFCLVTDYKLID